ncbi:MAG: anaerobic sulfatase maturase [Clostridia bacterium]|nr:anaerobic sulfatase maturase [Clostridia bacterium]
MPDINVLIKPASGACNLRCKYCFYADEAMNRSVANYGLMSAETLEQVIIRAFEAADRSVTFGFQGGEPTLCGLDFFRNAVALQKKHAKKGVTVNNAIQTNGLLIDDEWAAFLAENKFLTGLSVDGFADLHDLHRVDAQGKGSFARVMKAAQTLEKHKAEFNVLTVVTAAAAKRVQKIYAFYRKNNLLWQQYIPCLDPLGEERGHTPYALTPGLYASFLKNLFDLWYEDVCAGRFVYIRYFENLLGMLVGRPPESCGLSGQCALQFVVEADGSVYPCDFYVLDQHRMGNVRDHSFREMAESRQAQEFLAAPAVHEQCAGCRFFGICRGGCRRDRDQGGKIDLNFFCPAYREFFEYALPRMMHLARQIGGR